MPDIQTVARPRTYQNARRDDPPEFPRKRDGSPKRRLSWEDKLRLLDPNSPPEATEARLDEFLNLFAFRRTRGIVTRVGEGPRAWTELKDMPLDEIHAARHLLADRASPILKPQWVGARSLATSLFFCMDVDTDRESKPGKPPFVERCRHVERSLRRLGINPSDSRQVLVVPSPSGGRHYYVFFDGPYSLDQYRILFESAGLRSMKGQVEFFPSTTQGLRLPFGHVPGLRHDGRAWIQFIDDFKNGRIIRHSLSILYERLERHLARHQRKPRRTRVGLVASSNPEGSSPPILGIPKAHRVAELRISGPHPPGESGLDRYRALVERGIRSFREGEELLELGILLPSTRNSALNLLAAHLIWFRNYPAGQAAELLTRWAMDRRHNSVDIRSDLDCGTNRVGTQITYMCGWYERMKRVGLPEGSGRSGPDRFAVAEVESLRASVVSLPEPDRLPQAQFLLHFLAFAKRHGWVAADGSGREAAAAIKEVVKRWPGCGSKNYYKIRMIRAEESGVFVMVREKWQNPHGVGRARTYRLVVPVVDEADWTLGYQDALLLLAGLPGVAGMWEGLGAEHDLERGVKTDEPATEHAGGRDPQREDDPRSVHPGRPGGCLGPSPRPCDPQPPPAEGLPDQGLGPCSAIPPFLPGRKLTIPLAPPRSHPAGRLPRMGNRCGRVGPVPQMSCSNPREPEKLIEMCRAYEEAAWERIGVRFPRGPDRASFRPPS